MKELSDTLPAWAEAKHLSFIVDDQRPLTSSGLRKQSDGIAYVTSSELTKEAERLHELLYELGIVAPEHLPPQDLEVDLEADISSVDKNELETSVTCVCRADRFAEGSLADGFNSKFLTKALRRLYLLNVCNEDGWPKMLPHQSDNQIKEGIKLLSVSGTIEGRTTGSRRKCSAKNCPGWFIGVLWESGQQMYICSEGWHYDSENNRIEVIGGGEISARVISPKPLGVPPLPRHEWPDREALARRKGWRVSP
jgi:hypothetical protein